MNSDVHIKLKLYIKLANERYLIDDASLVSEGSKYQIIAKIKSKDSRAFSLKSKYWNDNMYTLNLNKEFSVHKAYLEGKDVKIRLNGAHLVRMYSEHYFHQDYTTYIWEISSFVLEMRNKDFGNINEIRYYLTGNSIGILEHNNIKDTFVYKGSIFSLSVDENDNAYIKSATNQDDIVNEILLLMSFYLRTPIECRMIQVVNAGDTRFEYKRPRYNIQEKHITHDQFMYLNIHCGETLADFIKFIEGNHIEDSTFGFIGRGIDNYVRSNYLDNLSKYILLYSVLAVFANKIHHYTGCNSDYERIKHLMDNFDLEVSVLDSVIAKKNFKDSKGNQINNFADLRNEIMHGLPSSEIIKFLEDESDVVSKMEFVTSITILKELGFSNISFKEGFENLSVSKG